MSRRQVLITSSNFRQRDGRNPYSGDMWVVSSIVPAGMGIQMLPGPLLDLRIVFESCLAIPFHSANGSVDPSHEHTESR